VAMAGVRGTRSVTGTSDALAATDLGYVVTYSNASAVAVSLAQAGTASLYDGWATWVQNTGAGTVTITPATSTINTAPTLPLATNMGAFIWSDGTNYHAYFLPVSRPLLAANNGSDAANVDTMLSNLHGVSYAAAQSLTTAAQGLALKNAGAAQFSLINGKIVESHASGVVTFAIKTFAGADPSTTDPVSVIFSDGTQAAITAALSVNSSNSSGTFGTASNVACRLWICLFNDSGTLRLGIRNCLDPVSGSISGFPGSGIGSSVGGNNTYGGTWTAGTVASSKPFVIVGFADYDSGVATAGTWGVSPSRIQLFGPGIKRPGDELQRVYATATVANAVTSTTYASGPHPLQVLITPQSAANLMSISFGGQAKNIGGAASGLYIALYRGGTKIGYDTYIYDGQASGATKFECVSYSDILDAPNTASTITYAALLRGDSVSYTNSFPAADVGTSPYGTMTVKEIMG
jgi:hypothetical protein